MEDVIYSNMNGPRSCFFKILFFFDVDYFQILY